MKNKKPMTNRKTVAIWLFFITVVLFIIAAVRFFDIMMNGEVNGVDLNQNLVNQYASSGVLRAERGKIFDANGQPIASDVRAYTLYAVLTDAWSIDEENPQHVTDPEKTATVLAQYIPMSEQDIYDTLTTEGASQVEFGNAGDQLTLETKKAIEKENLPGISFQEEPMRFYPNGVFASHVVGLAQPSDENSTDLVGALGLEAQFDDVLKGQDGSYVQQEDMMGYTIPGEESEVIAPVQGDDLYLTLDHSLQVYMETVISDVVEVNPSQAVTATLMEAETGRILATTQRPTFNASTKENIDATWMTHLSEYTFEPGSTLKVMSLAAAIEEGVFNPYNYVETGSVEINGDVVNDVKPEGWGTISELEALARSSNTLFVRLANAMGYDTWGNYLNDFGFGQKTGIELPAEAKGSNPYNSELQKANTSFGQGISVTPVQMMQAFSAVANDGKMVKPHLVDKIVDSTTGEETVYETEVVGEPISADTANQTLHYLNEAGYMEGSTTASFQLENYEAALKTGTAEVVDPETGTYSYSDKIYSVVGMAPVDDPKYILYVTVRSPQLGAGYTYGSQVTRDIYKPIMEWVLDRSFEGEVADGEETIMTPKVTDMTLNEGKSILEESGFEVAVVGSGDRIVQQSPMPEEAVTSGQKAIIMTNGAMSLPDLTGWSKNDALKVAELTGTNFVFNGDGYIVDQNVAPGQVIEVGQTIEFTLSESTN